VTGNVSVPALESEKVPTVVGADAFGVDAYETVAVLPTSGLAPASETDIVIGRPCDKEGTETERTDDGSLYTGTRALRTVGPRTPLGVRTRTKTNVCSTCAAVRLTLAVPAALSAAVTAADERAADSVSPT
jgi:hypothetical protein